MSVPIAPRCPRCNQQSAHPSGRYYLCTNCRMEFDPSDDGTIAYGPPDRRINREERKREEKLQRLGVRR